MRASYTKNKIQTFFRGIYYKYSIPAKRFGFNISLDNGKNPNVWISSDTQTYIKSKPFGRNTVFIVNSSEKGWDFIFSLSV